MSQYADEIIRLSKEFRISNENLQGAFGSGPIGFAAQNQRMLAQQFLDMQQKNMNDIMDRAWAQQQLVPQAFRGLSDYINSQTITKKTMNITKDSRVIVNSAGAVLAIAASDSEAEKRAADFAHSNQASVYIFRPVKEVAPKRDVVVTNMGE